MEGIVKMIMRVEKLVWTLRNIEGGNNTTYLLTKAGSSNVVTYLKFLKRYKLVKQYEDGRRKPFRILENGRVFLKIFDGLDV